MKRETITGRQKSGKTGKLIARANQEQKDGHDVIFYSWEMAASALRDRGLSEQVEVIIIEEADLPERIKIIRERGPKYIETEVATITLNMWTR